MRKRLLTLLGGAMLLMAATYAQAFNVVGYFISWGTPGFEETLRYEYLTHINYSFLLPTASGGINPTFASSAQLDRVVQLAHNKNVKVLISVGGWNNGDDSAFHTIAASPNLRNTFISNLYNYVIQHDLDGVDVDWEFPGSDGSDGFLLLMSELSARLRGSGKLLTAAVWGWSADGVTSSVYPYVDFLNLMTYDGGVPHSTYAMAVSSLNYWNGIGLPREKTILGIPFYGSNAGWDQVDYYDLTSWDANAPYKDEGGQESVSGYYYNSVPTVKDKTALAAEQAGGVMIWALNFDVSGAGSLLAAIHEATPGSSSTPVTITTNTLPSGTAGASYNPITLSASGGTAPYRWAVVSGTLPAGLALGTDTGSIGGVVTVPQGTFLFTVGCTDSTGQSVEKTFTIVVNPSIYTDKPPSFPTALSIN
jgi:chitinase